MHTDVAIALQLRSRTVRRPFRTLGQHADPHAVGATLRRPGPPREVQGSLGVILGLSGPSNLIGMGLRSDHLGSCPAGYRVCRVPEPCHAQSDVHKVLVPGIVPVRAMSAAEESVGAGDAGLAASAATADAGVSRVMGHHRDDLGCRDAQPSQAYGQ